MIRVLALTKYASLAATTRQRFLQYEPALRAAGVELECAPLLGNDHLRRLNEGRRSSLPAVAGYYARRASDLLRARAYDVLWVHCEFFPYLPGFMETAAASIAGRPIVFDFDDAIFAMYDDARNSIVRALLSGKLQPLIRSATACTCGNAYLRDYAARFCANSIIVPTVVDADEYVPRSKASGGPLIIGWIGSPSTWAYVRPLLPLLESLAQEYGIIFRAIGAGTAARGDQFPGLELVEWSENTEIGELQRFDIGIMPVPDDVWARGKSGYKLVQYMACGLPVVGSPVGVNCEIVRDGENGFLATTELEWRESLVRLIEHSELRKRMGDAGRKRAVEDYSLAAHAPRVVEVIKSAAARS